MSNVGRFSCRPNGCQPIVHVPKILVVKFKEYLESTDGNIIVFDKICDEI
jgi:hypothetical protein